MENPEISIGVGASSDCHRADETPLASSTGGGASGGRPPAGGEPPNRGSHSEQASFSFGDYSSCLAFGLMLLRQPFLTQRCLIHVSDLPERIALHVMRWLVSELSSLAANFEGPLHVHRKMRAWKVLRWVTKALLDHEAHRSPTVILIEGVDRVQGLNGLADGIGKAIRSKAATVVLAASDERPDRAAQIQARLKRKCVCAFERAFRFGTFDEVDGRLMCSLVWSTHSSTPLPQFAISPLLNWASGSVYRLETLAIVAEEHRKTVGRGSFNAVTLSARLAEFCHVVYGTPKLDFSEVLAEEPPEIDELEEPAIFRVETAMSGDWLDCVDEIDAFDDGAHNEVGVLDGVDLMGVL
ncbi:hypothetical protein AB4Y43_16135 [Paraburkholderia sp. BR10872]|uniref:hypothetical protein n=1 Tax=Paraburkholderia sp. BR10872 TaxID=3236989 RepID=UPI0034D2E18B